MIIFFYVFVVFFSVYVIFFESKKLPTIYGKEAFL